MVIREITFSRGMTINTGNFNSVRLDYSATAALDAQDNEIESFTKLKEIVDTRVRAEAQKINAKTAS